MLKNKKIIFGILLIIAIIVMIYIRFSDDKYDDFKTEDIAYSKYKLTYIVEDVMGCSADALKEKGDVYDDFTGGIIGEIVSFEKLPHKEYIVNSKGEAIEAIEPNRFDVIMTVISNITIVNDDKYLTDGSVELNVNTKRNLFSKKNAVYAKLLSMEKMEDDKQDE